MTTLKTLLGAATALTAFALIAAQASDATFKGRNGRLVYQAQAGKYTQLFTVEPDGTGRTQVTHFKGSGGDVAAWSKDGTRLTFNRHWDPGGPNERIAVYVSRANGTGLKMLRTGGKVNTEPTWFPNGRRIMFSQIDSGRVMVINANGTGLRPTGITAPDGVSACVLPGGTRFAFLRGKPGTELSAIFVATLFRRGAKRITPWSGHADKIDCSPDGKRIAYSAPAFSQDGRSSNVYTVRIDGSDVARLTHESGGVVNDGLDSWSPDGTKLAYVSNKNGQYEIWTMNADGTGATQLTHGPESHSAAWGPAR